MTGVLVRPGKKKSSLIPCSAIPTGQIDTFQRYLSDWDEHCPVQPNALSFLALRLTRTQTQMLGMYEFIYSPRTDSSPAKDVKMYITDTNPVHMASQATVPDMQKTCFLFHYGSLTFTLLFPTSDPKSVRYFFESAIRIIPNHMATIITPLACCERIWPLKTPYVFFRSDGRCHI